MIGIPAGVAIGHSGRGAVFVVNLANSWRAIPTLGLLVLLAVYLGFSFLTWLLPLVVLAIPPILVNAYEGVAGVEPGVRDAAKGAGMTSWQQVTRVEVPIALPLILVGLRTAAIFVVATATIAAYIGLGGLGRCARPPPRPGSRSPPRSAAGGCCSRGAPGSAAGCCPTRASWRSGSPSPRRR